MDDFLAYIKRKKQELQRQLQELDAAERIFLQSGIAPSGQANFRFEQTIGGDKKSAPKITIKEMVLKILTSAPPHGLTATEILERINKLYDATAVRTSLSPQLSRLKAEKKIVSNRPYWLLSSLESSRLRNQNGAPAPTDAP